MNGLNPVKKRPYTGNDNIRSVCTQQTLTGKIYFTFRLQHYYKTLIEPFNFKARPTLRKANS